MSSSTLTHSIHNFTPSQQTHAGEADNLVIDLVARRPALAAEAGDDNTDVIDLVARKSTLKTEAGDHTGDHTEDHTDVIDLTTESDEPTRLMACASSDIDDDAPKRPRPVRRTRPAARQKSQPAGRLRAHELRRHSRARRYERLEAVFAWAEAEQRPVHTDALLMIVESEANFETWPPDCWTEHGLWQFLWSEMNTACVLTGRPEPRGVPETMWLYLDYLDQNVGLAAGSDPIEKLQDFLQEYGDLTTTGTPRTPDDSGPSPAQFQLDLKSAA